MKKTPKLKRSAPAKKYRVTADSEGGIPLPPKLARDMSINIGDKFAWWKKRDGFIVVLVRNNHSKRKIPKHAQWGKVEPALPEILVMLPRPAKSANVKRS